MTETPQPAPTAWMPIETAPLRRSVLVSFVDEQGHRRTMRAAYFEAGDLFSDECDDDDDWIDENGANKQGSWFEDSVIREPGYWRTDAEPTHWMPLPAPPALAKANGQ